MAFLCSSVRRSVVDRCAQLRIGALAGLIYLLEDCFERLRDIRLIEDSKADSTAWAALPSQYARSFQAHRVFSLLTQPWDRATPLCACIY